VVQARTKGHILRHIVRFVKEGSRLHTDNASNFKLLNEKYDYDHESVDHSAKEYVRRSHHLNRVVLVTGEARHQRNLRLGFEEALAALPARVRVSP
jgi:hypothetical protein